jgi:hypothetical protein
MTGCAPRLEIARRDLCPEAIAPISMPVALAIVRVFRLAFCFAID